jgi:hypothetical protein
MYYTYLWLREDGTPYYVGKGKGRRAFMSQGHKVNRPKQRERIVIYPAASEADAFEAEIALIWYYGRIDIGTGILHNRTNGGDSGPVMLNKSNPMYGKKRPDLVKRNKKRLMSVEARLALIERNKSEKMRAIVSAKAKANVGDKNPNFGHHLSSDACRRISIARKGKHNSPATEFKRKEKPQCMKAQ